MRSILEEPFYANVYPCGLSEQGLEAEGSNQRATRGDYIFGRPELPFN